MMKLVTWLDIVSHDGAWMDISEAKEYKPHPIQTVGWVIEDAEDYIVLVSSKDNEELVGSVCAIPKSVIVSIECLSLGCPEGCPPGTCPKFDTKI